MNIQESLTAVLTAPSTENLWQLRADLRAAGTPADSPLWEILRQFHDFLAHLAAGAEAHQYSQLASLMDIGAVGGVALENLLQSDSSEEVWQKFLAGSISEGLMVLASRQYVKAFRAELSTIYQSAAWFLFDAFWQLSTNSQPDLDPDIRHQTIEKLLAPIRVTDIESSVKAVLIGRLFQILLLQYFSISASQFISR